VHWSDVVAQRLSERGKKHIVSTGITPSGEFHIGHLREILTGDMITKAAKKAGLDVEFVFIVDSADPLRKVYSFLDDSYSEYIGHQLKQIPPPNAEGCPDMERFDQAFPMQTISLNHSDKPSNKSTFDRGSSITTRLMQMGILPKRLELLATMQTRFVRS